MRRWKVYKNAKIAKNAEKSMKAITANSGRENINTAAK